MRTKLLRGRKGVTVQLVYPSTFDEYRQVLDALGGARPAVAYGESDSVPAGCRLGHAAYVVTTAQRRHLWDLPDLAVSGRAVLVDEAPALDLLHDAAANPDAAVALFRRASLEVVSGPAAGAHSGSWFDAVRDFLSPVARFDEAVGALDGAGLPKAVHEALSDRLAEAFRPGAELAQAELDRLRVLLDLPWAKCEPQRFDRAHVEQVLRGTHGALDAVQARIVRFLGSCPQACDLLTFEDPCSCRRAAAAGLPAPRRSPPIGSGAALRPLLGRSRGDRQDVAGERRCRVPWSNVRDRVPGRSGGQAEHRGSYRGSPGCVVNGLREAGVNNPVFILEAIDKTGDADEDPHPLLGVLDSSNRTAFRDAHLGVPLDLSGVLWIATATDAGVLPQSVREHLHIVDLPEYTEEEKLAIVQEHLLTRPFDVHLATGAGVLAPEPAALAASTAPVPPPSGPAVPAASLVVVADRVVSSVEELRALSTGPLAEESGAGQPWRTAASRGDVGFEPEAVRRVIRDYTSEPGVKDLKGVLAELCRQVVSRRPASAQGPDMVTSALVPALLGDGSVDLLPLAVRAAIETERARLSADTSSNASRTSPWIEWLESLPWTRRNEAAIDLKRISRVLDARQAGSRTPRRGSSSTWPRASGTRAARGLFSVSSARRGWARRRWRSPSPRPWGAGTSGCRAAGSMTRRTFGATTAPGTGRSPARSCASSGGSGTGPGLRARRGGQDRARARSGAPGSSRSGAAGPFPRLVRRAPVRPVEILFITTANEWNPIPPPLRDRLEVVELPGYTEHEKVAIARTHVVPAENTAAGLMPAPVRITDGVLRQIIRDYTSEPGIRQLNRRIKTICRKVTLGRETGDRSLDRKRVTARDVSRWLGADTGDADGLGHLRRRLDAPSIPAEVQSKGPRGRRPPVVVRLGVDRLGVHPFTGVPGVLGGPAVEPLHRREGRLGRGAGEAGREACRPRRGEGTPPRPRRCARPQSRSAGSGPLLDGPGGCRQDVARPQPCRSPRARVRASGLRRAGGRRGVAGRPEGRAPVGSSRSCGRSVRGIPCSFWTSSTG